MKGKHDFGEAAELAALYVAGALPAEERVAFEAHLASGCEACLAELAALGPVAQFLLAGAPSLAPEPELRDALLRRIESEGTPQPGSSSSALAMFVLRADEGTWEETPFPGIRLRKLFVDRHKRQFTALVRMGPGTVFPSHRHEGAEECLVLEGDLQIGDIALRAGDFERTPPGFQQVEQTTRGGCLLLITSPFD
jgi:anti-sigma factor ChrR (cupin superfamily)